VLNIGARHVPVVIADLSTKEAIAPATLPAWGYRYSEKLDKWGLGDQACDYLFIGDHHLHFEIPGTLGVIQEHATWLKDRNKPRHYPYLQPEEFLAGVPMHHDLNFVYATLADLTDELIEALSDDDSAVLFLDTMNEHGMAEQRRAFFTLMEKECDVPVIIGRDYTNLSELKLLLHSSTDLGGLLLDGLGDGVFIAPENCGGDELADRAAFGILQATRTRISKTEYISCPSCGRTLFDLQETTAKIRARTSHLKGVKIGIMGCIVNGPGEMADAITATSGPVPGVVTLYKEKERGEAQRAHRTGRRRADRLIKQGGDWWSPVDGPDQWATNSLRVIGWVPFEGDEVGSGGNISHVEHLRTPARASMTALPCPQRIAM
jgi:(E)-4-hydroxy-3-methylbut-2-enyl-diphosphate synthase